MTSNELLERVTSRGHLPRSALHPRHRRAVTVLLDLDALAAGMSTDEIIRQYPIIEPEDIRAAAAYGAWLAKKEIHTLSVGP